MQMMLRRTSCMNRRKEKKTEVEKTQSMIKILIEKKLIESNAQPGMPVPSNLTDLLPNFVLTMPE
jgi:hypothetical protein